MKKDAQSHFTINMCWSEYLNLVNFIQISTVLFIMFALTLHFIQEIWTFWHNVNDLKIFIENISTTINVGDATVRSQDSP